MSLMTISKTPFFIFSSASFADAAVSTAKPFISRIARRVSRIANSSSTSKMRRFMGSSKGIVIHKCGACCDRDAIRLVAGADFCHVKPYPAQYNDFVATYHVENFGCRATQADGAAIERQLLDRGLERAGAAVE